MNSVTKTDQEAACQITVIIRNNLEDFHVNNIPDSKMKELNTIIRNSLLQALHMAKNIDHPVVRFISTMTRNSIPSYWELPELPDDYKNALKQKNAPDFGSIFQSMETVKKSHFHSDDSLNENGKNRKKGMGGRKQ